MKVALLASTPGGEDLAAGAARLCYSSADIGTIKERISGDRAKELIAKLLAMGHVSPLEHISFTFGIEGVSRALTHQLVRHRIASYTQKSQRYVAEKDFRFVVPPSIEAKPKARERYMQIMEGIQQGYAELASMVDKEDARYCLPNACETSIIMTMNARSLHNFFEHRCCQRAQWEIRSLAWAMLNLVKTEAPTIFAAAGARCDHDGTCPEGAYSCGRWQTK